MNRNDFCKNWTFTRQGGASRILDLPHDAQLEESRSAEEPSGFGGAYFAGGKYIYEKTFSGAGLTDKAVMLQFGGVYRKAEVCLNGERVGGCAYGYSPFWVDLTWKLLPGENTLRVTADNSETPNSRWYSGAGIYRPVWLWTGERDHIAPEGVNVTTLSYDPARVLVETEIRGEGEVNVEILDGEEIKASGQGRSVELSIPNARLWSAETPHLYTCRVMLTKDGAVADTHTVAFGVRKLEWSTKGFFVNGKETNLRGGCVHHDNGILGAVTYYEAEERKVRKLKEWGFNAIRSAHNPASPELLEACDRVGMYVMDEMWDMWYKTKNPHDYALDFEDNWERDIEHVVRRDRTHPSVVLYSIGNEVTEPGEERGRKLAKRIVDAFHRLDPTRPTTIGLNLTLVLMAQMKIGMYAENKDEEAETAAIQEVSSADYNKAAMENGKSMNAASARPETEALSAEVLNAVDIAGYNYGDSRYPIEGTEHPDRILVGSETFPQEIVSNWRMVEKYPYLIGDFMWTAWDYLGEVGIGAWVWDKKEYGFGKPYPWLLAEAGVLDILGDDTAEAGLAAVVFEKRKAPYIGVRPMTHPGETPAISTWRGTNAIPSWSWRGCEGNMAEVEVFTAAEEAELFLNGVSLGRKPVEDYLASFELPYTPGELTAVTYENGAEMGRKTLRTAQGTLTIRVSAESELKMGRPAFIRVDIADENGTVDVNSDRLLTVDVTGARLLGFGSACPKTECSYLGGTFPSHHGRAMAVIIPCEEKVKVRVRADSGMVSQTQFKISKKKECFLMSIKLGYVPTRRSIFSAPDALKYRNLTAERLRELGVDFVDIDDINEEGLLYSEDDRLKVLEKFKTEKVDGILLAHCNFGTEYVCARLARDLGVPVLLWGPLDERPEPNGVRLRDTQCGLFATGKVLRRFQVPFTYLTNCRLSDPVFERGVKDFLAVCNVVKTFRNIRILQLGPRPFDFWSTMCNEGELLERFNVQLSPVPLPELTAEVKKAIAEGTEVAETMAYCREHMDINVTDEQLTNVAGLAVAMERLIKKYHCNAGAIQCWNALQDELGIMPCAANALLNDKGIPIVCETDIHGAITALMVEAATLDGTRSFFADWTIRHPDIENGELLQHCGPWPLSVAGCRPCITYPLAFDYPGAITAEAKHGDLTLARFDGDNGEYSLLLGNARGVDGPKGMGTYLWVEVDNIKRLEAKVVEGPYIHHCVGIHKDVVPVLYEACKYIGVKPDLYDPIEEDVKAYLRGE